MAGLSPDTPAVSIIVPVLNEADRIGDLLDDLYARQAIASACEVIVSDGGSDDETRAIAARYPCRLISSRAGRAAQMNAAAEMARGRLLLFLHADSVLPEAFDPATALDAPWGFFRLRLDGGAPIYRIIESMINWRTRLTHIAGGDQGLYFGRDFYDSIGRFPDIALMEDIEISKRARQRAKPAIIEKPITSSSRRWQQRGVLKTITLMWCLRLAYCFGVDPARLHRLYYPERG